MKASIVAALASAALCTAVAAPSSAQGRRVEDPNEGGSTASVRPSGEGGSTANSATNERNATITNAGAGRGGNASVTAHRERAWWEYAGVTPGSSEYAVLRRWARRRSRDGRVVVAWPGFQMTEQGSRLFLAVSAVPRITVITEPGRLVYRLERASVPLSNNRRALETVAFATPITRAYLRTRRGAVDLVVETRASGAQPTQSQQAGPEGITFIMLDFPRYSLPESGPTSSGATAPRTASATGVRPSQDVRPAASEPSSSVRPSTSENTDVRATGTDQERPPVIVR
jgi:hypothetical protein